MAKYVYLYRMTVDTGNAPCIFDVRNKKTDTLSLACCKGGQIRKNKPVYCGLRHKIGSKSECDPKRDDVYIVGIYKNCCLYVAKIKEAIPEEEYYDTKNPKYRQRRDCIYDYIKKGEEFSDKFIRRKGFNNDFHPDDENHDRLKHDIYGKYVLISEEFSYIGDKYNDFPVVDLIKELIPKRQEIKKYNDHDTEESFKKIYSYVEPILDGSLRNNPVEPLTENCKKGACQK